MQTAETALKIVRNMDVVGFVAANCVAMLSAALHD
jgi:hypothetical protein